MVFNESNLILLLLSESFPSKEFLLSLSSEKISNSVKILFSFNFLSKLGFIKKINLSKIAKFLLLKFSIFSFFKSL